ncbi:MULTISPECIES: NAD(P)-dependent oxidoreductase [unclassified Halomonas]|uniref:NAD(P)-dependent oxidoreductase n=1 Tax=unclassified Halomonas TaxID=2609666 RepID=UPI001C979093|nr:MULTISPECIES: NAD(P)-dependent oxidoreductase [unclassified Halomonas]MBY5924687.1 NAD(P)-dependent oxidoreductase [Halomonas sp. DP4Y7-2]MBY6231729.1 NAD(P)-dependent oxidoreductase [Halomonas sp. DP4Y7-1]
MTSSVHVGLIGVGLMGHGIAQSLLRQGHRLSYLDHPGNQPCDDLQTAGATPLETPRDVASAAELVILCVTGTPQVESVLFDPQGVLQGLKPEQIVVDCSTAIPSSTQAIEARVREAGGRFVDAAMTRTPKEAAEGRLNLIVGADKALFDELTPLFSAFAEHITHGGPVGAGHTLKLLHNFVSLGFTAVLAEASAASQRAGIDNSVLLEVLGNGGGGGVVLERLRPYLVDADPSGFRFSLSNSLKDVGYYHSMSKDLGASRQMGQAVHQLYADIVAEGNGERLLPELISLLADASTQRMD